MNSAITRFKQLTGIVFGIGTLPGAPGTWGSLAALLPIYFLGVHTSYGVVALALLCSALTLWAARSCEERWGPDPSNVVIDEWAGQALALAPFPFYEALGPNLLLLGAGCILFRLFDILKPLGIAKTQRLAGGPGILLDDLVAGVYAYITLQAGIYIALIAGIM